MSPPNSKRSSSSSPSTLSDAILDPNVFSDAYALESLDLPERSPFLDHDDPFPISRNEPGHPTPPFPRPVSPDSTTSADTHPRLVTHQSDQPCNSRPAIPVRSISGTSNALSDGHRTSITSSHFSMPRSQSPYAGPTTSSHPYGMYPQVTRASSTTSASTVRPPERSFVASGGPGHPYAMYSQTTVPEESDDTLAPTTIPLGFPGMSRDYQSSTPGRRDDIADIVGSDGHVEELPPYTRYAVDDPPLKEHTMSVQAAAVSAATPQERPTGPQSRPSQTIENGLEMSSAASRIESGDSSGNFKEKVKQKGRQKICCGLPLWFLLAIVAVLLFGVILGAVIGGVVGRKEIADSSLQREAIKTTTTPSATVTEVAVDGTSLSPEQSLAPVPTGRFNVALKDIEVKLQGCVQNSNLTAAWDCIAPTGLGIKVEGLSQSAHLELDTYPVETPLWFGAQPPNLDVNRLDLTPSLDRDDQQLGPALFAWTLYDKLTILDEQAVSPNEEPNGDMNYSQLDTGAKPWFCWFNRTMVEFFIYLDKNLDDIPTTGLEDGFGPATYLSTSTSTSTSQTPTSSPSSAGLTGTPVASTTPTDHPFTADQAGPAANGASVKFEGGFPNSFGGGRRRPRERSDRPQRRDAGQDYPRLMKIEEKRLPLGHDGYVKPYCRQMQILANGEVHPVENVNDIDVEEQWVTDGMNAQRLRRRLRQRLKQRRNHQYGDGDGDADDASYSDGDYDGVCACQWSNA